MQKSIRNTVFGVRLTEEERKTLTRLAEEEERDEADWFRITLRRIAKEREVSLPTQTAN